MSKWWWLPVLSLLMHGALAEPHVVLVTPRGETVMERVFMDELKRRVGPVRFTLIKPDAAQPASMAGLLTPPNMGIYNVSKHAVVSLTETLYQDLHLVSDQISASVLCPYFVPTGISQSHRNRPADKPADKPTASQLIGQAQSDKAVGSGKVSAADVAQKVFDAVASDQFYIYSHPQALGNVQSRMEAIVQGINPPNPFAARPEVGEGLRKALREASAAK